MIHYFFSRALKPGSPAQRLFKAVCISALAVLLLPACTSRYSAIAEDIEALHAEEYALLAYTQYAEPAIPVQRFALIPHSARPGYPITVAFSYDFESLGAGAQNLRAELLNAAGRRLTRAAFFDLPLDDSDQAVKVAMLAIPSTAAFGDVTIRIESADTTIRYLPFHIESREFFSETIFLDQRNTDIRIAPNPQRVAESQHIWAVFNTPGREIYTVDAFVRPVVSTRRTSPFGARRIFQYVTGESDTTLHNGIDYGIPIGTDVMASARGRVVVARYRIVTGNSVVIEHLPGLFSIYYHLDSIAVSEGSIVEAGTLLGLSGVTGLATGPHLHWEVRVSGESADPDAFLNGPILDKNAILRQLGE